MQITVLPQVDLAPLEEALLRPDGQLALLLTSEYAKFSWDAMRLFCHKHARYGLPTKELVEFINKLIAGRSAIEIGAGHGDLGFHLGITRTDSKLQATPQVKAIYQATGQPTIDYPKSVIKMEALAAVKHYKPQVVVASWVTEYCAPHDNPGANGGSIYGVKEGHILDRVETYIMIGNLMTHGAKKIRDRAHDLYQAPFLRSRAHQPEGDCVMIWNKVKS